MRTIVASFLGACLLFLVSGCGGGSNKTEIPKGAPPPPPKVSSMNDGNKMSAPAATKPPLQPFRPPRH